MIKKSLSITVLLVLCAGFAHGQGLNIPSKHWGISFGNSREFTGLRFNIIDKHIKRIDGINVSCWHGGDFDLMSGDFRGIGIGLPLASGTAYRAGLSVGLFGVAAADDIYGVNLGGLAVGSGENLVGINLAGLAVGSGNLLKGVNVALLAVGAGDDAWGINVGGLAAGAGDRMSGLNVGGLAVGAGSDMSGINLSLLAAGSGEDMTGFSAAGLAVGSGEMLKGVSLAGLAVGCGEEMKGLSASILVVGAPRVTGGQAALVVGGNEVTGVSIAPAYFTVKEGGATMTGLSISAFNHIRGSQRGVAIGIFNYADDVSGFQLGLLNHIASNPKGLRWLPIFNTRF